MRDAGILNKDFILIRAQEVAEKGEIVVFLIDDQVTVKYFFPEKERIILKPANPEYKPILVEKDTSAKILGKVTAVIRFY